MVRVEEIKIHPRFNIKFIYNSDICLLKTVRPLKWQQNVQPVCLPELQYSSPTANSVMVSGWGSKSFRSELMPVQLQEVSLDIISAKECVNRYEKKKKKVPVYKSQICTWTKGKDACIVCQIIDQLSD